MMKAELEILTISGIAGYLKVAERTIYRLAGERKILAFKMGGAWRFSRSGIDKWIKRQTDGASAARAALGARRM